MQSTQWVSLLAYVAGSYFGIFLIRVSQKNEAKPVGKQWGRGREKRRGRKNNLRFSVVFFPSPPPRPHNLFDLGWSFPRLHPVLYETQTNSKHKKQAATHRCKIIHTIQ